MMTFPGPAVNDPTASSSGNGKRIVGLVEDPRNPSSGEDFASEGEPVGIEERLIVSPVWGRLRGLDLSEGQTVEKGMVIGLICERGDEMQLVCHVRATFLSWLAHENERVRPGTAVARLRVAERLEG